MFNTISKFIVRNNIITKSLVIWNIFYLFLILENVNANKEEFLNSRNSTKIFELIQACLIHKGVNPINIIPRNLDSSSEYNLLNHQWNSYGGHKTPLGFLLVQHIYEVQAGVRCGRDLQFNVVPKSGGHSFEKYSFGFDSNTIVIDLQHLNSIYIDSVAETVNVGPGVLIGPLTWALFNNSEQSFVIPSGLCPSVGISFALGGGFGLLPRTLGLTLDYIIELELIDADGNVHVINQNTNSDLFWALRGAGLSASFGIVTRFKFKLTQAPRQILHFKATYKIEEFSPVFKIWQNLWLSNLDSSINSILILNNTHITLEFIQVFSNQNNNATTESKLIDKIIQLFPSPVIANKKLISYPQYLINSIIPDRESYNFSPEPQDLSQVSRFSFESGFYKTKSFFCHQTINMENELDAFKLLLNEMPDGCNLFIEAMGNGSAINQVSLTQTSFIHRTALYHVTMGCSGTESEYLSKGKKWLQNIFETTHILLNHTESYQNYADKDLENHLDRYYGTSHLRRLIKIKKQVDPDNYFHSPESIPLYYND